jgi:hypothetical protein
MEVKPYLDSVKARQLMRPVRSPQASGLPTVKLLERPNPFAFSVDAKRLPVRRHSKPYSSPAIGPVTRYQ